MSFVEIMQTYFRGERIEALYYILPAGLLLIGLGITALNGRNAELARSTMVTIMTMVTREVILWRFLLRSLRRSAYG